jgi:hypothetical protein
VTTLRTVALDAGETIVDETGQWTAWAEWLGHSPFTVMVALGAVLDRGEPFTTVFRMFDDTFDIDAEIDRRDAAGTGYRITAAALHRDVRPAATTLTAAGLDVVVAGTMTVAEQDQLTGLDLPVRALISHRELGTTNRAPVFFEKLAAVLSLRPGELAYVSHRHDVVGPAAWGAGVQFRWLRRGPIARIRPPAGVGAAPESLTEVAEQIITERSEG